MSENSGPKGQGHSKNPPPPPPKKSPPPPPPPPPKKSPPPPPPPPNVREDRVPLPPPPPPPPPPPNVREDRVPLPPPPPPRSDGVQTAQDAAVAAAAAAKKLAEEAAKLAAAGPNFQGVGVDRYLDKNGNVPTIKTPTKTGGGGNNTRIPDETGSIPTNPAMPETPEPIPTNTSDGETAVRIAKRNVTDIASLVPQLNAEHIAKILFENVSAIELSIVERHDTIEGINQKYSIISNLAEVRKKYDAGKQLSPMDKFKPLTSIYTINIQDKIPQEDYIILENLNSTYQYLDENNQIVTREKGYYYIDTNGDLVIELINLEKNQQVEVLIDTNGTIYKVES